MSHCSRKGCCFRLARQSAPANARFLGYQRGYRPRIPAQPGAFWCAVVRGPVVKSSFPCASKSKTGTWPVWCYVSLWFCCGIGGSKLSRAPTSPHQRPEPPRPAAWTAPAFPVASGWSRWWRGLVRCFRQNLHPSRIGRSGGKKKGKPRNHALSRCATINCPFLVLVHCRIGSSENCRARSGLQ